MKKKEKQELQTKTTEELKSLLKEAKSSLLSMRLDLARDKLKNSRSLFLKRKEIARILTWLNQKEEVYAKKT